MIKYTKEQVIDIIDKIICLYHDVDKWSKNNITLNGIKYIFPEKDVVTSYMGSFCIFKNNKLLYKINYDLPLTKWIKENWDEHNLGGNLMSKKISLWKKIKEFKKGKNNKDSSKKCLNDIYNWCD